MNETPLVPLSCRALFQTIYERSEDSLRSGTWVLVLREFLTSESKQMARCSSASPPSLVRPDTFFSTSSKTCMAAPSWPDCIHTTYQAHRLNINVATSNRHTIEGSHTPLNFTSNTVKGSVMSTTILTLNQ